METVWSFAGVHASWSSIPTPADGFTSPRSSAIPKPPRRSSFARPALLSKSDGPRRRLRPCRLRPRRVNDAVHRILRSLFAVGAWDNPPNQRRVVDVFKGLEDAQKIAEESIVLLKSAGNQLPLSAATLKSIAVIGSHADVGVLSGAGLAQVNLPGGNAVAPPPAADQQAGRGFRHRSLSRGCDGQFETLPVARLFGSVQESLETWARRKSSPSPLPLLTADAQKIETEKSDRNKVILGRNGLEPLERHRVGGAGHRGRGRQLFLQDRMARQQGVRPASRPGSHHQPFFIRSYELVPRLPSRRCTSPIDHEPRLRS